MITRRRRCRRRAVRSWASKLAAALREALKKSVMNVEEELRGRGTTSLWRCREADRQNMLGLATIGKHDGEVQMSARPRPTQSELLDEDLSFLNPSVKAPAI